MCGHAPENGHDQIVGLGSRIDGPADFRNPQGDAVMLEDGHGQAVLVAIERPVRLADHHRLKAAIGTREVLEQTRGLRATLPGQGTGLTHVEVLDGDLPVALDEGPGPPELPAARRFRVLLVLGGHSAVEGKPDHGLCLSGW